LRVLTDELLNFVEHQKSAGHFPIERRQNIQNI
jgi:hypothetical protein